MNDSIESDRLLFDANTVRELDRIAIEEKGIAGIVLMKRAGKAVFSAIKDNWPDLDKLLILCGPGNNGGDGYIVAGLAIQSGVQVRVFETADPQNVSGDAKAAREYALEQGVEIQQAAEFDGRIDPGFVVVDALLGTGFRGDPREGIASLITSVNQRPSGEMKAGLGRAPVVSVDIPSGLDASTGKASSFAVQADVTVSFIGRKSGAYTSDGRACSGKLIFADLDVPDSVYSQVSPAAELLSLSTEIARLMPRSESNHKGSHGRVLVVGGDEGMGGAPLMAAESAARMGAGLVSVVTHPSHVSAFLARQPELMVKGISDGDDIAPFLDKATIVAIGPGLGVSAWGQRLLQAALASGKPLVLDADALNLIADKRLALPSTAAEVVMTPHPGEAARLLSKATADIQSDRFSAVAQLVDKFGGVQVLKGSGTLISAEDKTLVCPYGNPGMGTGGMGDVLTGIVAGLWAQGMSSSQAAKLGVCLHSAAADKLASRRGQQGLLATDLIAVARELLNGI